MAHIFANGIQENASAPGTGAVTVTGAVPGYRQFSSKCAVGDTVHYRIEAVNGLGIPQGDWEVGRGTYSAANTLTRTTVLESSNANAAVNFTGACRVQLTVLAPNTSAQALADWQDLLMTSQSQGQAAVGGSGTYGVTRVTNPGGGALGSSNATETGAIKITLPVSWTNSMLRFTVKIYNYSGGDGLAPDRTIHIGGYTYSTTPAWLNTFAYQEGAGPDVNVRFGHDGTFCCVWIGEVADTWQIPQIAITEVEVGYTGQSPAKTWANGWALSFVTAFVGTPVVVSMIMGASRRVAGVMAASDTSASFEIRNNGGTGDSNLAMIRFWAIGNYGIKLGLRADGYFGLGGWSSATWRWYVSPGGDMVAAGNVIAYSDERLKTNWKELPKNYVYRLSNTRVGVYDRTDTKLRQVGVSAQSLRKLLPWAVTKGIDGKLGVSYGHAALASAIALAKDNVALRKELKDEIKTRKVLERRLARLEKTVLALAAPKKGKK
jgi:hypothetical protein